MANTAKADFIQSELEIGGLVPDQECLPGGDPGDTTRSESDFLRIHEADGAVEECRHADLAKLAAVNNQTP